MRQALCFERYAYCRKIYILVAAVATKHFSISADALSLVYRSLERSASASRHGSAESLLYIPTHQGWRNDSRGEGGGGLGLGDPRGKGFTSVSKGPKPPIPTTIAIAEKQSKRSKKGPFLLYIGPPGSHSGNEINGARRGRSPPVPPPPVSPAMLHTSVPIPTCL